MRSLFYPSYGQLEVNEQPVPKIGNTEVLVRVSACGICGSELETFASRSERRMPPLIMGHEFCGVVAEIGKQVTGVNEGSRIVSNSIVSCGRCTYCLSGETNLCRNREVFGMHRQGAFAEYVNVPANCLIPMGDTVDFLSTCLTEPLANGVHMVEMTRHLKLNRVIILGAGPIGLMAQQAFQALRNVKTIVSDLKEERLNVAKRLGAEYVVNPGASKIEDLMMELTSGEGADLVIDAVGMETTNSQGFRLLRAGGTLVMIGLHQNSRPFQSYDIILPEKKIMGSYAATQQDMKTALNLIAMNKVDVSSWINYYPLSDGVAAFTNMQSPENNQIKSVIFM